MADNSTDLKNFAQVARRQLREQVAGRLEQVLRTDSAELREREAALKELREQITQTSKAAVIDRVAYTWFNRFCALRFMDVNRYSRMGVVSPAKGLSQPEILQEAKRGYIDDDLKRFVEAKGVFDLLNGQRPSADPQQEAYRLLLVAACNYYNEGMPFLFEKIADYTELLMPLDLLSEHAVLHDLRKVLTPEACQDVEVIGWLYQYYISERKEEVIALKKKIEAADIPAATQLFTPHWIVRYLVENSLGRLWLLNHPNSRLVEKMDYFIAPEQEEADFLQISNPEELRLCDPACGSGHILTYAFDLIYAIYEEAGYPATDIPRLILENNLYGIEIDPRAGALAAFALTMKACAKDRRFLSRAVQPNICVLENVTFTPQELDEYMRAMGRDRFTAPLLETLRQFEEADNFGSLIRPALVDATSARGLLEASNIGDDMFLHNVHLRVLTVLKQAEYLAPRYHVVITNPPYMGIRNMNDDLGNFIKDEYPDSKADFYSVFVDKNLDLAVGRGIIGMITIPNWMFLSSFERFRDNLLKKSTILSLIQNGRGVWGSDFGSCSFVLLKNPNVNYLGSYKRLFREQGEVNSNDVLEKRFRDNQEFPFYRASSVDFRKIPTAPIAFSVSPQTRNIFEKFSPLENYATGIQGMITGDNEKFMREWYEVARSKIDTLIRNSESQVSGDSYWIPYNKGGAFRKWYGNNQHIVYWKNKGSEFTRNRATNSRFYFREYISWSYITIGAVSARYFPRGYLWDVHGSGVFQNDERQVFATLGRICSKPCLYLLNVLNPTVSLQVENILALPIAELGDAIIKKVDATVKALVAISKADWDSFETSRDFEKYFLLGNNVDGYVSTAYKNLCSKWQEAIRTTANLEQLNNQIFIDAYGLEGELDSSVPLDELSLSCNPHYRYGGKRSDKELEVLLKADTLKEFISYAVGCMFGRYSLDKPGLVLANQGETLQDYLRQVPEPSFLPDDDNAIPILDGEWFSDDITERFKKFLRVTFGDEHYAENVAFIEDAIGRDIRSYFVKEFYSDHLSRYQKRPIYWLFSSPKGIFNVLIYMHRYKPDTLSVILNRYLREFCGKLEARKAYLEQVSISGSASPREKTAALKELEKLKKTLEELRTYERDTLYPLATQKLNINLDDGVKVNYKKFGTALAKIAGL